MALNVNASLSSAGPEALQVLEQPGPERIASPKPQATLNHLGPEAALLVAAV